MKFDNLLNKLDYYGWPLVLLGLRLSMVQVFWLPGKFKLFNIDSTILLFKLDYKTPFISPEIASYLITGVELIFPILIAVGYFTRLSTLPLLFVTAVIQLTYLACMDHFFWTFALTTLLLKGPGPLSIDHWLSMRKPS